MDEKNIKAILNSATGQALKDYLLLKLEELKDIGNIELKDFDPTKIGTETMVRLLAYRKVKAILENILTFTEEKKEKDPRDSFQI